MTPTRHPRTLAVRWPIREEQRGYETSCHIWQGSKMSKGYGQLVVAGRYYLAHRFAFVQAHGPTSLPIDHLCSQKDCVRLDHLEAVTASENLRRAYARGER